MEQVQIHYGKDIYFPEKCSCCLQKCKSDEFISIEFSITKNSKIESEVVKIPTCQYCQKHFSRLRRYKNIEKKMSSLLFIVVLGVAANSYYFLQNNGVGAAILAGLIMGGAVLIIYNLILFPFKPKPKKDEGHLEKHTKPAGISHRVINNQEILTFSFGKNKYASLFKEQNSKVLYEPVAKESVQKVACTNCGKMVLPSTISKTGGYCMPCFKKK